MVSLVKCGRWKIGGQQLWDVGDWELTFVGGGRLWVKICGRWEIGTHVSPPHMTWISVIQKSVNRVNTIIKLKFIFFLNPTLVRIIPPGHTYFNLEVFPPL